MKFLIRRSGHGLQLCISNKLVGDIDGLPLALEDFTQVSESVTPFLPVSDVSIFVALGVWILVNNCKY